MRSILFAAAMMVAVASCAPKSEDAAPAATTAEEVAPADAPLAAADTMADDSAGVDAMSSDAMSSEAAAIEATMALACVKDTPAATICTMDINACGHASVCNCGDGYTYNASLGKCLLVLDGVSEATIVQVADNECVTSGASSAICTRDINVCGQPSNCSCEDGFAWNAVAGKCLKDLSAPAE